MTPPDWTPDDDSELAVETQKKTERPKLYRVLLHNDDYTTMEFVVKVLMTVFGKSADEAMEIMLAVHHRQVGVAGIYPYEIAETKVAQVIRLARAAEFPLLATTEPEE